MHIRAVHIDEERDDGVEAVPREDQDQPDIRLKKESVHHFTEHRELRQVFYGTVYWAELYEKSICISHTPRSVNVRGVVVGYHHSQHRTLRRRVASPWQQDEGRGSSCHIVA